MIGVFICNLLVPLIMILAGWLMYRHPPEDINSVVGYRTSRSMKNSDTWLFAQHTCGKLWRKLGIWMFLITLAASLCFVHTSEKAWTIGALAIEGAQLAVMIGSIFGVEKALQAAFDEQGNRR